MTDLWACSQCRSLNPAKASRCYKCRTPREVASTAPTELPTVGPAEAVRPAGRYRSSAFRGVLASAAILGLAVVGIAGSVIVSLVHDRVDADGTAVATAALPSLTGLAIARLALIAVALVAFAAWLSRVIENIPPLTGSYPQATPRSTIIEVLIPFFNFFRIPAILREALRLLEPRGGGDALVAAAVLPLVAGLLGDWPGSYVAAILAVLLTDTAQQAVDAMLMYSQVLTALVTIGSVMLVAVIARVERQSAARARDGRDEAGFPSTAGA